MTEQTNPRSEQDTGLGSKGEELLASIKRMKRVQPAELQADAHKWALRIKALADFAYDVIQADKKVAKKAEKTEVVDPRARIEDKPEQDHLSSEILPGAGQPSPDGTPDHQVLPEPGVREAKRDPKTGNIVPEGEG